MRSKLAWKHIRLPIKLVLIYMPLIILPASLGMIILTHSYTQAGKQLTQEYTTDLIALMVQKMEDRLIGYEQLSKQVMTDERMHEYITQEPTSSYSQLNIERSISELLNVFWLGDDQNKYVYSIKIDTLGATYTYGTDAANGYNIDDELYRQKVREAKGSAVWFPPETYTDGYRNVEAFRLSRVIRDRRLQELGLLTLVIDTEAIHSIFNQTEFKDQASLKLVDASGRELLSNGVRLSGDIGDLLLFSKQSMLNGWRLSAELALDPLVRPIQNTTRWAAVMVVGCAFLGLILTHLISIDVIIPIRRMMANMKRGIKGTEPRELRPIKGAVEIVEMNDTFISVMYEIEQLIRQVLKKEQLKREAEIRVLQNQLSPHFLYNTLNSIRWMAIIQKQDNIKEMIEALSKLLTYTLRSPDSTVPIGEEIRMLQDYVKIQKVRYDDFRFEVSIEPEAEQSQLLKFLLQPVLENALIHGLASADRPGVIVMRVTREKADLIIEIRDNGVGIAPTRLADIQAALARNGDSHDEDGQHIGLNNVQDRIRHHHDIRYGLTVDSMQGEGTCVTIRVPYQEGGEAHAEDHDRR